MIHLNGKSTWTSKTDPSTAIDVVLTLHTGDKARGMFGLHTHSIISLVSLRKKEERAIICK